MTAPTFGERFRALREYRGWSIAGASRRIGWPPSYISQIESDQDSPSPRDIETCAAAFDLSVLELLAPLYEDRPAMSAAWDRLNLAIEAHEASWRAVRRAILDIARQDMARQYSGPTEEVPE